MKVNKINFVDGKIIQAWIAVGPLTDSNSQAGLLK